MRNKKMIISIFSATLMVIILLFIVSVVRTNKFNSLKYETIFDGEELFNSDTLKDKNVSVNISFRDQWEKPYDFDNTGNTGDMTYQGHTYDFTISNNSKDTLDDYSFKLVFKNEAYLQSAWNGSIEVHQIIDGNEVVETITDLRNYNLEDYNLRIVTVEDNIKLVAMKPNEYIVYIPSKSNNAVEAPIGAKKATTPGINMLLRIGDDMKDSFRVEISYTLYRTLSDDAIFWVSNVGAILWTLILVVIIILYLQNKKFESRLERDNEIISESIETFTGFIDAKDPYTNGHSKRVAIYTKLIAEQMGFEGEVLDRIYYIALLHDCGKIGVPDNILGKPGKLTDEEFEIIKSHTVRGGEILSSFKSLENAGDGALYHHERYDGRGYPKGLKGDEIPLIARMICVADAFDAMNTNRVYRDKRSKEYIINELEKNKGAQFDPEVADIIISLINDGKINIG